MSKRWIWALVAVTLLGGALRAAAGAGPEPVPRRSTRWATSTWRSAWPRPGRYGRESLHWPPGAPVAFAPPRLDGRVATRASDIPAAYAVQWFAGTALIPLVFLLALRSAAPRGGAGRRGDRRDLSAADRGHRRPAVGAARRAVADRGVRWRSAGRRYALGGLLLAAAVLTRGEPAHPDPGRSRWRSGRRRGRDVRGRGAGARRAWSLNASALVSTGGGSVVLRRHVPARRRDAAGHQAGAEGGDAALRARVARRARQDLPGERVLDAVAARRPGPRPRRGAARRGLAQRADLHRARTRWASPACSRPSCRACGSRRRRAPTGCARPPMRIWHLIVVVFAIAGALRLRDRAILAALIAFTAFHCRAGDAPLRAADAAGPASLRGCARLGELHERVERLRVRQRVACRGLLGAASPSGSA